MKNIYNKKNNIAVAVFSFNRPDYLKQVISSLEKNADLEGLDFYMFQDGAINKFSKRVAAKEDDINKCVIEWVVSNLPNKTLIRNSDNLGIGITQYQAKVFLFDEMKYDEVIFFEDDLILSKHYLRIIRLMLKLYKNNTDIGAVTCHGIGYRFKDRNEKEKRLSCLTYGNHNLWGWAMWKDRWEKIKPIFGEYYSFIKDIDYKYRPHLEIASWYKQKNMSTKASSQDGAVYCAFFLNHYLVLNTRVNRGQYIGAKGEHMTPEIFESRDYYRSIIDEFKEDETIMQFEDIDLFGAWNYVNSIFLNKKIADNKIIKNELSITEDSPESRWNYLNQADLFLNNIENFKKIEPNDVNAFFSKDNPLKIINIHDLSDEDKEYLKLINFKIENIIKNHKVGVTDEKYGEWFSKINKSNFPDKHRLISLVKSTYFQQEMVEGGYLQGFCPVTGIKLRSQISVSYGGNWKIINYMNGCAYRFTGQEVFYTIVRSMRFMREYMYFPNRNLIISFVKTDEKKRKEIIRDINIFKSHLVLKFEQIKKYICNPNQKQNAVIFGDSDGSLYHLLVNSLTGVEKLKENGLLQKVDYFIIPSPEVFGQFELIFPEIPNKKIIKVFAEKDSVEDVVFDKNLFALRVCDSFVNNDLARKINEVSVNKCPLSEIEEIKIIRGKHRIIIWITIRVDNRSWVSQAVGIANILNKIYQNHKSIGVIFDGWNINDPSVGKIHGYVGEESIEVINREKEIVRKIQTLIAKDIYTYNYIGCSLSKSIVLANYADFYISPHGAGLTKIVLLANKPGITHTNITAMKKKLFCYEREDIAVQIEIPGNFIKEVEGPIIMRQKKVNNSYDEHFKNYECDWEAIYNEAESLISKLKLGD
jgi:hypothetical protein